MTFAEIANEATGLESYEVVVLDTDGRAHGTVECYPLGSELIIEIQSKGDPKHGK